MLVWLFQSVNQTWLSSCKFLCNSARELAALIKGFMDSKSLCDEAVKTEMTSWQVSVLAMEESIFGPMCT